MHDCYNLYRLPQSLPMVINLLENCYLMPWRRWAEMESSLSRWVELYLGNHFPHRYSFGLLFWCIYTLLLRYVWYKNIYSSILKSKFALDKYYWKDSKWQNTLVSYLTHPKCSFLTKTSGNLIHPSINILCHYFVGW